MTGVKLTPQLAALFASLVEDASGLHYGTHDRALFEAKLVAQAEEAGFDTLLDYYYRLRYDDPAGVETRALVQALVVHETYFFRELGPLERLVDSHLVDVVHRFGRARVWSAACSTGEEPVTLAMLLDDRGILDKVDIVATDISETAIARARRGRHSRRSVRDGYPAALAARYLDISDAGVTSAPRIRDAIQFRTLNLLDAAAVAKLGQFDVILCRNVLIYFRDAMIAKVVDQLARALAPHGLLAVGVSESLLRFGTALVCEERGGAFFYRRER